MYLAILCLQMLCNQLGQGQQQTQADISTEKYDMYDIAKFDSIGMG